MLDEAEQTVEKGSRQLLAAVTFLFVLVARSSQWVCVVWCCGDLTSLVRRVPYDDEDAGTAR